MKKLLNKLGVNIISVFEKIAVIRTRQALSMLSDNELTELGITRQQLANGNFFQVKEISNFIATNVHDSKVQNHITKKAA